MRVWQATPSRWRVDVLSDAGERDTYQLRDNTSYIWDSGNELLTEVRGPQAYRLPRPADLVPPALALRLLSEAGRQASYRVIAPVRVAGQRAAGLRVTPTDPASTVGRVDIWADPSSGLPLLVEIYGRGLGRPALESQFFQVSPWHPDQRVLTPVRSPGTGFTVTGSGNLAGALSRLGLVALPAQLAGRIRQPGQPGPARAGGDRAGRAGDAAVTGAGESGPGDSGAAVIRTRALTKRYGAVTAVRSVDLEVRAGDRYGLLGPNGSGKTTLVRMLLGLVYATSGETEVLGRRMPRHAREGVRQMGADRGADLGVSHLEARAHMTV